MARAVSVVTTKKTYLQSLTSSSGLFKAVQPMAAFSHKNIRLPIHPKNSRRIIGLSFLTMVAAWEEFVEAVFVRYLAGAPFPNGHPPGLRLRSCSSLYHAYQLLSGQPHYDPAKRFLTLGTWSDVVAKASIYFDKGRPFSGVSPNHGKRLQDACHIRNRVAHRSRKATASFIKVAKQHLGMISHAKLSQGFDVGALLLKSPTSGFSGTTAKTLFEAYYEMLKKLADLLAP